MRTPVLLRKTRLALPPVVIALCGAAVASPGAAAASNTSDHVVRSEFAALRKHLKHAHGLSATARHELLATARRAENKVDHHACAALSVLEDLRQAIRNSAAPHAARVDGVEVAVLGTGRGRGCGFFSQRVTIDPEGFGAGPMKRPKRPRKPPKENRHALLRAPSRTPLPNAGRPTSVVPISPGSAYATGSSPFAFSTLTSVPTRTAFYPEEPSVAKAGQVVWLTGNSGAAFSLDGGATFTRVNVRDLFPEGVNAFCCDQHVVYAPQINRFIWIIQYSCKAPDADCNKRGSSNLDRLAVASPEDVAAHHGELWQTWALTPGDVGRRYDSLDYPALGLGPHDLYVTSNLFHGGLSDGAVVARVPLAQLKSNRPIAMRYHVDPGGFSYEPLANAAGRGVLASHDSATRLLTLTWNEASPLVLGHRTRHTIDASSKYRSLAPGRVNWEDGTDDSITGATERGNEIWLAWSEGRSICTARCNGDRPRLRQVWPEPHVHVVVLDARSLKLERERFIHNPRYAIAYPSLATDSLGRVGMSFAYGGGTAENPTQAAGYLTGGETFRQIAASPAPIEQGDFFSLSRDWPDGAQLVGSGYVAEASNPDGSTALRWLFYRYSR